LRYPSRIHGHTDRIEDSVRHLLVGGGERTLGRFRTRRRREAKSMNLPVDAEGRSRAGKPEWLELYPFDQRLAAEPPYPKLIRGRSVSYQPLERADARPFSRSHRDNLLNAAREDVPLAVEVGGGGPRLMVRR